MKNEKWYVGLTDDDISDNEYEKFADDLEAIKGFLYLSSDTEDINIYEIWECNDDECLSPNRLVWPSVGCEL